MPPGEEEEASEQRIENSSRKPRKLRSGGNFQRIFVGKVERSTRQIWDLISDPRTSIRQHLPWECFPFPCHLCFYLWTFHLWTRIRPDFNSDHHQHQAARLAGGGVVDWWLAWEHASKSKEAGNVSLLKYSIENFNFFFKWCIFVILVVDENVKIDESVNFKNIHLPMHCNG